MEVEGAPKPPVWGEGERPSWLAPEEAQPKKREWSPARDRMEAALELRARLKEQRQHRRSTVFRFFMLPFMWSASFLQALVVVGRRRETEDPGETTTGTPRSSSAATLDTMPAGRPLVAPSSADAEAYEAAPGEPEAGPAPVDHPDVHWPMEVAPAHPEPPGTSAPPPGAPVVPDWDWRPTATPAVPPEGPPAAPLPVSPPASPPAPLPTAAPAAPIAPTPTRQLRRPEPLGAVDAVTVVLGACSRESAAEAAVAVILQDDRLVVRASSGLTPQLAGQLALDVMGELCLDVIASGQGFIGNSTPPPGLDPFHPASILCVPIPLGKAQAGVLLLAGYAAGHAFTDDHRRMVSALVEQAAQSLVDAGVYQLPVGTADTWRRVSEIGTPAVAPPPPAPPPGEPDVVPSTQEIDPAMVAKIVETARARARALQLEQDPMATMTLDPATLSRIVTQARTAREAAEAQADAARAAEARAAEAEAQAEAERVEMARAAQSAAEEAARAAQLKAEAEATATADRSMAAEPAGQTEATEAAMAAPVAVEQPAAPAPVVEGVPWTARVRSQMGRIQERKEQDRQRYRAEILAAVRNLSWDGYHALIADIFRRKAFEVFPPPAEGTDLDVIDMVVDRDGQRRLVNCQLRGIDVVPVAAVSEMATVVYNYNVAGAYLISDGQYDEQATEYGPTAGIVLVDSEALIDLVIETTLKDERKASVGDKLAGVFRRGNKKAS